MTNNSVSELDFERFKNNVSNIIPVDEELRKNSILFSNGDFLFPAEDAMHPNIRFMREVALRKGIRHLNEFNVSIKIIRALYVKFEALSSRSDNLPMEIMAGRLITECANHNASDLHIKIEGSFADIYIRKDGDLFLLRQIESVVAHNLLAALYNNADDADATYKINSYQSARIAPSKSRINIPESIQAIRLQFNPMGNGGRYLIARFLYGEKKNFAEKITFDPLKSGFHPVQIDAFARLRRLSLGVNIISGPTGSGKSTTLKNMLELLYEEKKGKVNIISIEDPPEYEIEGTAQLPITNVETEEERGREYRKAIIAALRSDPDIIMPGEARDAEVISLVFTAAMTGHQVWTSLHANSALSIFDRLKDQGVDDFKLTDPDLVTGLIAQRLVKKLCNKCCVTLDKYIAKHKNLDVLERNIIEGYEDSIRFANESGCDCCYAGYTGRTVIAEIVEPDTTFLELVCAAKRKEAVDYWVNSLGGITMAEHAWLKVIRGEISVFDAISKVSRIENIPKERRAYLNGL